MSQALAEPAAGPSADAKSSRWRPVSAVICLVLAAILTIPAGFAYWGQRTLNDTQRYVDTVGPLVRSPKVQDAIATTVSNAIQKQVNVEGLLNDVFTGVIPDRPRLQELVGPISAAVNGLIDRQVHEFIASQTFEDLWVAVNTHAQQALQRVLNGDNSGAVSIQGQEVVLDLSVVIAQVKQRLADRGLSFVANAPLPTVDRQIVLLDAPQLKQVRTMYAFANPVAKWLLYIVILLYVAAYLLARRRPRMTIVIGVVLAVNAILLMIAIAIGRQLFVNELAGTVFGPASSVFYNQLLTYLVRGRKVLLWLGLILVFVGWFQGAHSSGDNARRSVTRTLEDTGSALPSGPVAGVAAWVHSSARWLRLGVLALGVVVLMWGNQVSPARLVWSSLLVIVLLIAIQVLIGADRPKVTSDRADEEPTQPIAPGGPVRAGT